jgi:hypothetical protein
MCEFLGLPGTFWLDGKGGADITWKIESGTQQVQVLPSRRN